MDILKPGRDPKDWSLEIECTGWGHETNGGCGAILLVRVEDLYLTDHCGDTEDFYYPTITCPGCGLETDLKDADRPRCWATLPSRKIWLRRRQNEEEGGRSTTPFFFRWLLSLFS